MKSGSSISELQHREPQEPSQVPTEHSRASHSTQGQSSKDQTTPNVPVLQLYCLRQHFPICSSPHSPVVVAMLQFHLQVLELNSSPRLLVKVKPHNLGLTVVRNIPPSSIKHWNNIPHKNLDQGLSLGCLTRPDVTFIHIFEKPCDPSAPNSDAIPNPLSPLFTWMCYPIPASLPGSPHQAELFLPPNMSKFSLFSSCFDVLGFFLPCCWDSLWQAVLSQAGNVPWGSLSTCQHLSQGQGPSKAASSSHSLPTKLIRAQLHQDRHPEPLLCPSNQSFPFRRG